MWAAVNVQFRVTSHSFQHFQLRSSSLLKIRTSFQRKANEAISDIAAKTAHLNYFIVWHRITSCNFQPFRNDRLIANYFLNLLQLLVKYSVVFDTRSLHSPVFLVNANQLTGLPVPFWTLISRQRLFFLRLKPVFSVCRLLTAKI